MIARTALSRLAASMLASIAAITSGEDMALPASGRSIVQSWIEPLVLTSTGAFTAVP